MRQKWQASFEVDPEQEDWVAVAIVVDAAAAVAAAVADIVDLRSGESWTRSIDLGLVWFVVDVDWAALFESGAQLEDYLHWQAIL